MKNSNIETKGVEFANIYILTYIYIYIYIYICIYKYNRQNRDSIVHRKEKFKDHYSYRNINRTNININKRRNGQIFKVNKRCHGTKC